MESYISKDLLIQEIFHGIFAIPFAYLLWKKTKSSKSALSVIALSYAIDLDHLVDYFAYYGVTFNLSEFLSGIYFELTRRAYVPFHAWEWVIALAFLSYKKGWKSVFTLILFALLPHLIYDSITVGSIVFYSIIYRASSGFINLN